MTTSQMQVELTVMAAKNIKAGDITGTSDAYIKIKSTNNKFQTKMTPPTLNPYWEEKFILNTFVDDTIEFKLFDKDKHSKDDKLGKIKYSIPMLVNGDTKFEIKEEIIGESDLLQRVKWQRLMILNKCMIQIFR